MRLALSLGLLVMLWSVVADAATVHHPRGRQHVIARSAQEPFSRPDDAVVPPGWYKFPGHKPIPPEENRNLDPSNRGGA
ncbi:hypothetical protein JQ604_10750 [Bradyrhizobium jicamae]|uniref:hypothetical protein n=1 Tax=Bradyrhizobium jicamae TaxID=280332 RepID=UPI001BAC6064|nr:hypothetical protein [Bradyrhizobium jicamae]MBR0752663.1 hypothetical protein [Bradyrhizobium jicamae]